MFSETALVYIIGVVIMMAISLASGAIDRPEDKDVPESWKLGLLVLVGLTWPYQICAILYFLVKKNLR